MATKKGRCVICGQTGKLSSDHVPPRTVVPPTELTVRSMVNHFGDDPDSGRPAYEAPTFPTLCEACNSQRLGIEFDPELGRVCNMISAWVTSRFEHGLLLGAAREFEIKVNRLARAVIGHLLAATPRPKPWAELHPGPMHDSLRAYFLDPLQPLPSEASLYWWPYPSSHQVILRGFVRKDRMFSHRGDPILGDLIKFFPVGFWLTWESPSPEFELPDLARYTTDDIDSDAIVPLHLEAVPPRRWPETPGKDSMLLVNVLGGFFSVPRRPGKSAT